MGKKYEGAPADEPTNPDAVAGHDPVVPAVKNPWSRKPQDQVGDQNQVIANSDVNVIVRDGEQGVANRIAENQGMVTISDIFGKWDLSDGKWSLGETLAAGAVALVLLTLLTSRKLRVSV